jgi:hypothetical protein
MFLVILVDVYSEPESPRAEMEREVVDRPIVRW